jgi:dsRNA-specific ribonuclease
LAKDFARIGIGARHITGYSKNRDEILQTFRAGDLQVITNFGVLTEGFDDPSIECVLLARPTTSPLVYSQCLGRGLRSHPGKKQCTVIDIIDRTTHKLQYNAYEAAGFKAGWTPSGKDPLREAKAISRIKVVDPAIFLKIKNALSLEETQTRLMSLPEGKVISGLDGGPLLRYEMTKDKKLPPGRIALDRILDISKQLGLEPFGVRVSKDNTILRLATSDREKIPTFFDWHIKNATGTRPEIIYVTDDKVIVNEPYGEQLKDQNPKGRLLELVAARKVDKIDIRVSEAGSGFEAQGTVWLWDGFNTTSTYRSRTKKKHAEQGAAQGLFEFLSDIFDLSVAPKEEVKSPPAVSSDPRIKLNEMVQRKILLGFGYEEAGRSGADHEPIFHTRAWVDMPGPKRQLGPKAEAKSKKDAQAKAAALLYDAISHLDVKPEAGPIIKPVNKKPIQERMQMLREGTI